MSEQRRDLWARLITDWPWIYWGVMALLVVVIIAMLLLLLSERTDR